MSEESGGLPEWALTGRRGWTHVGASRPRFATAPGPGQESVWDYPRPPALVADPRRVRVELEGVVIADTTRALRLLETSHPPSFYVPRSDVHVEHLTEARGSSRCEWKGVASYWDVSAGDATVTSGAWSYEAPFGDYAALTGHLCFYPSRFACFVNDERARPQAGGFYGGWITDDVVGPFKGEPGTFG